MTISAAYSADNYAGNGSTTVFAVTFAFLSVGTNLKVSIKVDATGVVTEKTITTHYTVSGSNVTMGTAPASGETLIIELNPDFKQTSDYAENSSFPAETLETDLDERTLEGQINKDNLSKIFHPFFTTKELGKGTGLGLSISYGLIKEMNGTINVMSIYNGGTSFKITLPI